MVEELIENLNGILKEKNEKIKPENIREGIQIFDITGEFKGGGFDNIEETAEYQACLLLANSIEVFDDYTGTTATAEDIREGKTAYSNGERIVGTMEVSNHNTTLSVENTTNFRIQQNIKEIDMTGIDTSNVKSFLNAYFGCSNLKTIKGEIDCSSATSLANMFQNCPLLEEINLKNTENVELMSSLANGNTGLKRINLFNTKKVYAMGSAFSGCTSLEDIPQYDTSGLKTTGLQYVFSNCPNLTDESLNNILVMCMNAVGLNSGEKTLKYTGLSSAQATRCQSLSNWQAFVDAGWKTGY